MVMNNRPDPQDGYGYADHQPTPEDWAEYEAYLDSLPTVVNAESHVLQSSLTADGECHVRGIVEQTEQVTQGKVTTATTRVEEIDYVIPACIFDLVIEGLIARQNR